MLCFLFPGFWHIQIKTQVTSKPVNMLNCLWLHEKLCLETGIESRMPVSHEGIPTKIIILPFWWGGSTDSSKFLSTVSKIEFYHPKDNDKINSVLQKSQKYSFWYHFSSWLKTLKVNTFLILIIDSHSLVSWAPLLVGSLWLLSMLCMWPSKKKNPELLGKKVWRGKTILVSSFATHSHAVLQPSILGRTAVTFHPLQPSGLKWCLWAPWWKATNRDCGALLTHFWI